MRGYSNFLDRWLFRFRVLSHFGLIEKLNLLSTVHDIFFLFTGLSKPRSLRIQELLRQAVHLLLKTLYFLSQFSLFLLALLQKSFKLLHPSILFCALLRQSNSPPSWF